MHDDRFVGRVYNAFDGTRHVLGIVEEMACEDEVKGLICHERFDVSDEKFWRRYALFLGVSRELVELRPGRIDAGVAEVDS